MLSSGSSNAQWDCPEARSTVRSSRIAPDSGDGRRRFRAPERARARPRIAPDRAGVEAETDPARTNERVERTGAIANPQSLLDFCYSSRKFLPPILGIRDLAQRGRSTMHLTLIPMIAVPVIREPRGCREIAYSPLPPNFDAAQDRTTSSSSDGSTVRESTGQSANHVLSA